MKSLVVAFTWVYGKGAHKHSHPIVKLLQHAIYNLYGTSELNVLNFILNSYYK